MFMITIVVLVVISILFSLWSLRGVLNNSNEAARTKKDLAKNRVIFQNDSALSKE